MVYFVTIGQLYKTTSFLVVSTSFHSEMRKSVGNNEETTLFFITITKLKHATRVTTLWLKQPSCFYSVAKVIAVLSLLIFLMLIIDSLPFMHWSYFLYCNFQAQ